MTTYNVEKDDDVWAEEKVRLMLPDRRKALMRALIRSDRQGAFDITGAIGRVEHGERVAARAA